MSHDRQSRVARSRRIPRLLMDPLAPGRHGLPPEKTHYLRDVLRLALGSEIELIDGRGHRARAVVEVLERDRITIEISKPEVAPALACSLTVGLASPKQERADWAVEKLTEIGVDHIVWIDTERAVSKPRPRGARTERWRRLAEAAACQSGRATVPALNGPVAFADFLALRADQRFIGDASGVPLPSQVTSAKSALLAIGPEGGFSDDELEQADASGFLRLRVSSLTLRVETAAVVGAGLILSTAGGWR